MLTAFLLDDESNCVELLALQLEKYCPDVRIVAKCTNSHEAAALIRRLAPELLFLDIAMPGMNAFQLLESLSDLSFKVIFVTAYDEFAIRAFRFSALDYLLKPVDNNDLITAVAKAEHQNKLEYSQLEVFKHHQTQQFPRKLAISHGGGIIFIELKEIVYCESDSNYTRVYLIDGKQHVLTKTLREVQSFLEEYNFMRVHRQYIVNLDHIRMYKRGEGNYLVMNNEVSIPIGRQQKDRFLQRFGWL